MKCWVNSAPLREKRAAAWREHAYTRPLPAESEPRRAAPLPQAFVGTFSRHRITFIAALSIVTVLATMCATEFCTRASMAFISKSRTDCGAAGMVLMTIVNMLMILLAGSFMGSDGASAERDLEAGKAAAAPQREPDMMKPMSDVRSTYSESLVAGDTESRAEDAMRTLPSGVSRVGGVHSAAPADDPNLLFVEGQVAEAGKTVTNGAIRI